MGYRTKNTTEPVFEKEKLVCEIQGTTLYFLGSLSIHEAAYFSTVIYKHLLSLKHPSFVFDISRLEDIDSAGVMALYQVKKQLNQTGVVAEFFGASDSVAKKLELFKPELDSNIRTPIRTGFFEGIGTQVLTFFTDYVFEFILLAANVFYWAVNDLFNRKARRKGEFVNQSVHIGVNATLIVVFLSFVIGYVMALQSSGQLMTFGANIFVVDLVVIAVTSQMGPLIAGILVAGRSGSAIAAEIATMKVTSELDALQTMGLNPIRFVVVPKLYACLFTMPFLIILANVSGVLGGALAANIYLDITSEIFFTRTAEIMSNKNLITGFVKSQVYASIIVLTGSFYGFRVERGAEGVGLVTTISVVVAITLVILADSILGMLFY